MHGSATERTEAKLKLSHEVRKHHTYYRLSREGRCFIRSMKQRNMLEKYLTLLTRCSKAGKLLSLPREAGHEHVVAIARVLSMRVDEAQCLIDRLIELEKETRCLHKYYRLTRLGELVTRYMRENNMTNYHGEIKYNM